MVSFNREGQLMDMMALSEAKGRQSCVVRMIVVERERGGSKLRDDDMSLSQGDISLGKIE